ncbi:Alpha/Beta hydrolase protein [Aspergillus bertholletiae]|uniref:Alpha/Beta hydrolase protein n=1 Tax=Aspergillus bertholletiae TaxID=1226010 RepID=A0A5N7BQ30_9EURO|nr:Alpha/Beta hydrolase protein [Aspergillus bertholletiae]
MEDLSRYGIPNDDWKRFVATNPLPDFPSDLKLLDIQGKVNAEREAAAKKEFNDSGLGFQVSYQHKQVHMRDNIINNIRVFRPGSISDGDKDNIQLPVYVFYHGGGFFFGSERQNDYDCARLAIDHRMIIVNANYRHTPTWTYPTQHNDAWDVFDWVMKNIDSLKGDRSRVIIGGVSAGANLAAHVVRQHLQLQRAKKGKESPDVNLVGLVMDCPWLLHPYSYPPDRRSLNHQSYVQCADAPLLPMKRLNFFARHLGPVPNDLSSFMHPNLFTEDLEALPPTVVMVAGNDPFRDEGWVFATNLTNAGVPVNKYIFPGMPHGFWRFEALRAASLYRVALNTSFRQLLGVDQSPPKREFQVMGYIGDFQ